MRAVSLLFLSLVFCGSPASADPFSSADLHPLLRVHAIRSFAVPPNINQLVVQDQDYFISRGGALLSLEPSQFDGGPFSNFLVRGVGEPTRVAALKRVLAENQVGALTSCELDTGGPNQEPYELTWYGREGRRNTFVAILGPGGGISGLAPCPPQVGNIIQAIGDYRNHVVNRPGTEVLQAR